MPLDSLPDHTVKADGLAARAMRSGPSHAALMTAAKPSHTPNSNTGYTLRHPVDEKAENAAEPMPETAEVPQSAPPAKKARKSRARKTSPCLDAWLDMWFFDWLSVTIPNGLDGKGSRRGTDKAESAKARAQGDQHARKAALDHIRAERIAGKAEDRDGRDTLCMWAVSQGLHQMRVGRGRQGYDGGLTYGASPVDTDALAVVQAGHATNMPGLIISGGDGACADLAPAALDLLGPVLLARADVSWDWSQEGFFDALLEYARRVSKASRMASPRLIESDTGRTFYWGDSGSTSVKVYQKDLERVASKKLAIEDADPDLVRIEYRIAPSTEDKRGMAMIARDHGPGALLGTSHWVRRMVEHIGDLTGMSKKGAKMAVTRVDKTPDPRTCEDRAAHGLTQYAGTLCSAVIARIVADKYDGDWRAAEISEDEVRAGVVDMVGSYMDATGAVAGSVTRLGVDHSRSIEDEAERGAQALADWMERQEEDADRAQSELLDAAMAVALRTGAPMPEPEAEASPEDAQDVPGR